MIQDRERDLELNVVHHTRRAHRVEVVDARAENRHSRFGRTLDAGRRATRASTPTTSRCASAFEIIALATDRAWFRPTACASSDALMLPTRANVRVSPDSRAARPGFDPRARLDSPCSRDSEARFRDRTRRDATRDSATRRARSFGRAPFRRAAARARPGLSNS